MHDGHDIAMTIRHRWRGESLIASRWVAVVVFSPSHNHADHSAHAVDVTRLFSVQVEYRLPTYSLPFCYYW